jgi:hypothetical protein
MHRENEPVEEDFKEVRVEVTKEMTFTIPMNTKNEAEVRQSIKGLVEFIEDNLKLTVRKIIKIKGGPKIREAYEVLDDWYRERHIKRIQEQGIGRREKRARIHMIRSWPNGTHESEETLDEIGYLIGSKGDLQQEKHQKAIQEIDEEQEKLLNIHKELNAKEPRSNHKGKGRCLRKGHRLALEKGKCLRRVCN